jgi:hypothetical protein
LRQIGTFYSQWQQMISFDHQAGSHGLPPTADHSMLILSASLSKLPV